MTSNYWRDRMASSQSKLTGKSLKAIQKQMRKYYGSAMKSVISEFENTYNHLLTTVEEGREITPADLYKLDKYWKLQGQMRGELTKLGDRQIRALSKIFETNFFDIYYSIGIEGMEAFSTLDVNGAKQMINQIWCADGKSWSQRIWDNTTRLMETLNEELISCVATGKKTSELKKKLQERFGVSYSAADSVARTELAQVQTQAAKKRYEDYGIQYVQVWGDADERRCPICKELHQKKYAVGEQLPIPAHPRCRCCIVPVID